MSSFCTDEPSIEIRFDSVPGEPTRPDGSRRISHRDRPSEVTCELASGEVEVVDPAPIQDPLIGATIADRYRVLARIGSGGIGHVYKVEHTRIGKLCAMKLLSRAHATDTTMDWRFRREALAISKLESPNTVQVFDFGVASGVSYLVMELVRGETLGALLGRLGPLSPMRVLKIAIQICSSLEEAHAAGIIHRDIKPDNVMIVRAPDGSDVVKVVDFGLAKLQPTETTANEVTGQGTVLGTPHYMAPEQILGEQVDARADIYALGGLLYRVLSGHFPFDGRPVDVLRRCLLESPVPLATRDTTGRIPRDVCAIVERCLDRDPARRFASIPELQAALVASLRELTSASSVRKLLDPRWVQRAARTSAAPIATRDDVDAYERRLRTRRSGVQALLFATVVGASAAVGGWAWQTNASTAETREREPNDAPDEATRIGLGQPVRGHVGKRIDPDHGDRDHFVFDLAAGGALAISVQALPNMALCADLYRSGLLEPVGGACAAAGVDVATRTVPLPVGRYLVVVHQDRSLADGAAAATQVVENVSDEYTLTIAE